MNEHPLKDKVRCYRCKHIYAWNCPNCGHVVSDQSELIARVKRLEDERDRIQSKIDELKLKIWS